MMNPFNFEQLEELQDQDDDDGDENDNDYVDNESLMDSDIGDVDNATTIMPNHNMMDGDDDGDDDDGDDDGDDDNALLG